MNFWDNLIRYPRFFVSSLAGLVLVLLAPLFQFSKEVQNKKLLFLGLSSCIFLVLWILNLMLYSSN